MTKPRGCGDRGGGGEMNLGQVLAILYSHEINAGVQTFFDAGYKAWIGDPVNGIAESAECFDTPKEAGKWLWGVAISRFPELAEGTHWCQLYS